jgi:tetratricopeptide (TPR) repeat protein
MKVAWHRAAHTALWRLRLTLALWRGQPEAVLGCVRDWLQDQPDHPHALATWAHWLANTQDFEGADRVLQRLLILQPQVAAHWFNAGFVQQSLGRLAQAQHHFETATQLNPALDRAWYGLGLVRIALGDLKGAEAALRRNTELQPMSPSAWYQLAHLHHERGELSQAHAVLNHLRGFEPRVAQQVEREWAGQAA